jgi:hypothetical protein
MFVNIYQMITISKWSRCINLVQKSSSGLARLDKIDYTNWFIALSIISLSLYVGRVNAA